MTIWALHGAGYPVLASTSLAEGQADSSGGCVSSGISKSTITPHHHCRPSLLPPPLCRSDEEADPQILCELKSTCPSSSQAWSQKRPRVPLAVFYSAQCFEILVITRDRLIRVGVSSGWLASAPCSGNKGGSLPRELIFLQLPL